MSDTGPVINILFFSSKTIFKIPSLNLIATLFSTNLLLFPAAAVAQAAVPHALVRPAPLSQTLTKIFLLSKI